MSYPHDGRYEMRMILTTIAVLVAGLTLLVVLARFVVVRILIPLTRSVLVPAAVGFGRWLQTTGLPAAGRAVEWVVDVALPWIGSGAAALTRGVMGLAHRGAARVRSARP